MDDRFRWEPNRVYMPKGLCTPTPPKPKQYKSLKPFRAIDMIQRPPLDFGPRTYSEPSELERSTFTKAVINWNLGLYDPIPPEKFIPYAQKHDCFIAWLIRLRYIEEVKDESFEITLTIENDDVLEWLWHRLNFGVRDTFGFEEMVQFERQLPNKPNLWQQVNEIKRERAK